jgi:cytochrome c peroxidase
LDVIVPRLFPILFALVGLATTRPAQDMVGEFPVPAVPEGNPLTPAKILLGKALFFEEQLSSDDTMACATCHRFEAGGGDPRPAGRHPGVDGRLGTKDDEFGSLGVVQRDAEGELLSHALFGNERQVTARTAPSVVNAAFFNVQFWDTRALPTFKDESGATVLADLASLESQAVGPILSPAEMGHVGRTWAEVCAKLGTAVPLALASDLPPALQEFVGESTNYGPLFARAFGDAAITRERIAMAIASYERTLVSDRSPFDLGMLTEPQKRGYEQYLEHGACEICHHTDQRLTTDGSVRTISLPHHPRAVKTPSLRNVGLRKRFMSGGQLTSLDQVLDHYISLDFIHFETASDRAALLDFLVNGLTDPRLAQSLPPFDRPRLASERAEQDAAKKAE